MKEQDILNFNRIKEAIEFIQSNYKSQPSLDEIAAKINLSPFHFQRLFSDWAGTSPKKFLQFISIQHAKSMLTNKQATLFDTTYETGLSSTSRLHELFVRIEGMTPAEYKNEGKSLTIRYQFSKSPFGNILIASTSKGICRIVFITDESEAMEDLKHEFPKANFIQEEDKMHSNVLTIFQSDMENIAEIKLHLKGTDFQLKVWEALLKIPSGYLSTYGDLAKKIGNPNASRAVGTAIGSNPVAYLIPCHRVIQSTGLFGGYMWEPSRKAAIIGWEAAKNDQFPENL